MPNNFIKLSLPGCFLVISRCSSTPKTNCAYAANQLKT